MVFFLCCEATSATAFGLGSSIHAAGIDDSRLFAPLPPRPQGQGWGWSWDHGVSGGRCESLGICTEGHQVRLSAQGAGAGALAEDILYTQRFKLIWKWFKWIFYLLSCPKDFYYSTPLNRLLFFFGGRIFTSTKKLVVWLSVWRAKCRGPGLGWSLCWWKRR